MDVALVALTLLIAANATPVLASLALRQRWATPLNTRLFGGHKTWRGLATGVAAAALVGAASTPGAATGALFGLAALTGDLGSSFLKRRLHLRPGTDVPLLDQLPEALLPLLLFGPTFGATVPVIVATAVAFTVLDMTGTHIVAALRNKPSKREC